MAVIEPTDIFTLNDKPQSAEVPLPYNSKNGFDFTEFNAYVRSAGYSPDVVRTLIEAGFQLRGSGRFAGKNHTRYRHIRRSAVANASLQYEAESMVDDITAWLKKENVILTYPCKGRRSEGGLLSVNNQFGTIPAKPLRNYVHYAFGTEN